MNYRNLATGACWLFAGCFAWSIAGSTLLLAQEVLRPEIAGFTTISPPASILSRTSSLADTNGPPTFDININLSGSPTPSQAAAFTEAEAVWENFIHSYQDDTGSIIGPTIHASIVNIDGPGGILGQAGPTNLFAVDGGSFTYTNAGIMQFDAADVITLQNLGVFNDVILHEMGHVLGIGTLWDTSRLPRHFRRQQIYTQNSGQYTGAFGLEAYNAEFDQTGTFVPVELGGGLGTRNSHWDEANGGNALTGRVSNVTGLDMRDELMTGWLGGNPTFISSLTVQSLVDIGYNVVEQTIEASIDIWPESPENRVSVNSRGMLLVALLGTEDIDVANVELESLLFGDPVLIELGGAAASPVMHSIRDFSGDGLLDLSLSFDVGDLVNQQVLGPDTIEGLLVGQLLDGTRFEGLDSIVIVPPQRTAVAAGQIGRFVPEPASWLIAAVAAAAVILRPRQSTGLPR